MLDYEWTANTSTMILTDEEQQQNHETHQQTHNHHHMDTTYTNQTSLINNQNNHLFLQHNPINDPSNFHHFHTQNQPHQQHSHLTPFYDPRGYTGSSSYVPPHMLSLDPVSASGGGSSMFVVPKSEQVSGGMDFTSRMGLNLGVRTYFSSTEDDFVNRLYRRSRAVEPGSIHSPRCQAEGCNADLTHAKHYHRRHKVCEYHSKAATVVAAGLTQRFCQQCSRFHLLSEFDNGKRSCRKRLADHNRRRRKSHQANQESQKNQLEAARTSSNSDNIARSPPDSAGAQLSSVTIAMSPPKILLDCFRQRPYHGGTASSTSSSSVFFSTG